MICWNRESRCCSDKGDHFCYHFTTAEINFLNTCVAWLVIGFLFISNSCIGFDVVHFVVFRVQ